jgi:hypothetical protein
MRSAYISTGKPEGTRPLGDLEVEDIKIDLK